MMSLEGEYPTPRRFMDHEVSGVYPLVVIDPEDVEQVERLAQCYIATWRGGYGNETTEGITTRQMRQALREFANPTPPKPEEPTGLGAVVEDAEGQTWLRDWRGYWRAPDVTCRWAKVDAVRVLSPGVEAAS